MLTTTDVREEANGAMTAEAMESRFDAIDRKLLDIDYNLVRESTSQLDSLVTVRLRLSELREMVFERLFQLGQQLGQLTRDVAALQQDASERAPGLASAPNPAGVPGTDHGERQDAESG